MPCEKNVLLLDFLVSQHLFETLQTSLTFKNSEKVVKSGCFEKLLQLRAPIFFQMMEGSKVSCAQILMFWYTTRRSILFEIFTLHAL